MERLTYNEVLANQYYPNENIDNEEIFNKLGKLEDIEEELGIPLEVLFKALKDGIYHIQYDSIFVDITVTLKGNIVFQDSDNNLISLKDYGVTWSLTREELEDAKD